MAKRLAAMSIIVENPDSVAPANELLHEYSSIIVGRMGIPLRDYRIAVITIVCLGENDAISSLSGALGRLPGMKVKVSYSAAQIEE